MANSRVVQKVEDKVVKKLRRTHLPSPWCNKREGNDAVPRKDNQRDDNSMVLLSGRGCKDAGANGSKSGGHCLRRSGAGPNYEAELTDPKRQLEESTSDRAGDKRKQRLRSPSRWVRARARARVR